MSFLILFDTSLKWYLVVGITQFILICLSLNVFISEKNSGNIYFISESLLPGKRKHFNFFSPIKSLLLLVKLSLELAKFRNFSITGLPKYSQLIPNF